MITSLFLTSGVLVIDELLFVVVGMLTVVVVLVVVVVLTAETASAMLAIIVAVKSWTVLVAAIAVFSPPLAVPPHPPSGIQ